MTPKQADKAIKDGKPVKVHSARYNETFTITIVSRDRWCVNTDDGDRFERSDIELVKE